MKLREKIKQTTGLNLNQLVLMPLKIFEMAFVLISYKYSIIDLR
jgi:hypothetical protein